jgi:nicotinamidase-related amidase
MTGKDELLKEENTGIVLIDVQDKLFPYIHNKFKVSDNIRKLLEFAKITEIPIILTEQNPKGLGRTIKEIKDLIPEVEPVEKYTFSCVGDENFVSVLDRNELKNIIVVGIETHICVTQTVIDLLSGGYIIHVISDAVGSRSEFTHNAGISRMRSAGAVISTLEMVMYEYLKTSKHPKFRDFLEKIMK